MLKDGTTVDGAREIFKNPQMRTAWENMTGKALPDNEKSAVKMIMQTRRSNTDMSLATNDAVTSQNASTVPQNTEGTVTPAVEEKPAVEAPVEAQQTDSTSVNDNPKTHTKEEIEKIEEYKNSTDTSLKEILQNYESNGVKSFARHNISHVSEKQSDELSKIIGGNYSDYSNAINTNAINHIFSEHGKNGVVNHSMQDLNDFARIGYVLTNFDKAELSRHKKAVNRDLALNTVLLIILLHQ